MQKTSRLAAALLVSLLVLAACGGSDGDTTEAKTADVVDDDETNPDDNGVESDQTPNAGLTDQEIAEAFYEAVLQGDRDAAFSLASEQPINFWEPWEPIPDLEFQFSGNGTFFLFAGGPPPFQCTVADGLVNECLDEPTGDDDDGGDNDGGVDFDDPDFETGHGNFEVLDVEPGGEAVTRNGALVRGDAPDTYQVFADGGTGQTLDVSITSLEDNAAFFVSGPNGELLANDTGSVSIELEESGDYFIDVSPTRGNATYELTISVSVLAD